MSRTKRTKDPYRDDWKATADHKPWFKPPAAFKKAAASKRKARARQAVRTMADPEELILPAEKRTNEWDYN